MNKTRNVLLMLVPVVALSFTPITPALAHGHDYGRGHGHGFGPFGAIAAVVGVAAAIVTAPFVFAAEAVRPVAPAPVYYPQPAYYYPPAQTYAPPPAYNYGPPPGYYAPPSGYYPAPQPYYPPR